MLDNGNYHAPVLLDESIQALAVKPDGIYIDVTFGGGGHTRRILQELGPDGKLIAFDQDEAARPNLPKDQRLIFIPHNFRHLLRFIRFYGIDGVDGILADLGVSSHQFDVPERGFSYRFPDELLDMRMNREAPQNAADLLNSLDAATLQNILGQYGEVRNARTLAQALVERRRQKPFRTVGDLLDTMQPHIRGDKFRYMAQVFQALRIAVNEEMEALQEFLQSTLQALKPGGRLVVITYHSLEDRLVKRFMRDGNVEGEQIKNEFGHIHRPFEMITRTPISPNEEELQRNRRAHSARLRVVEMK